MSDFKTGGVPIPNFDEGTIKEKKGAFSHFAGGLGGGADSLDGALGDFTPPGSSGPLGGGSSGGGNVA